VVVTTYLQSKVMTPAQATADPQAAAMSSQMTLMMPIMIGFMSLQFPSGLSIYWIIGNIVSVVQYAITTPVNWKSVFTFSLAPAAPAPAAPEKGKSGSSSSKKVERAGRAR
jgi:YidC/Oxa1 family membrane protein insertase